MISSRVGWILVLILALGCQSSRKFIKKEPITIFLPDSQLSPRRYPEGVPLPYSSISIVAVGDLMMGARVLPYLEKDGPLYPFENTRSILRSGDLCFANLEAPFTLTGEKFTKEFNFKVPPQYAQGLTWAGIDVVSLANNHIMDYGKQGLITTLRILEEIGVEYCGAGLSYPEAKQPAILEKKAIKVAFLAYSMTFPLEFYARQDREGTCYPYPQELIAGIEECERLSDYTVVSFHWGGELMEYPKDYQQYFAHLAVDYGADLVIGHHPHVLQGMEIYHNRLIAYSLGNFVFGSFSARVKDSAILKVHLSPQGLFYAVIYPISVYNAEVLFQPKLLREERRSLVLQRLCDISRELNQGKAIIDDSGIILGKGEPIPFLSASL